MCLVSVRALLNSLKDKVMKKTVLLSLAVMASYILAEAQFVVTPKVGAPVEVSGNVSFSANADNTSWSIGESYDSSFDLSQIASISFQYLSVV